VTIVVVPRSAGTIRNTATVKGDQKDPVGGNNKATAASRRGSDRLRGGRGLDRCLGGSGRDSLRGCERGDR
jgi:hypothetical protein